MTRCIAAWIACVSILLAAFAPTLAHALPAGGAMRSVTGEICSATGLRMSKADRGPASRQSGPAQVASHFDHCPYCYTHGGAASPPAIAALILPAPDAGPAHPALFYQSPRTLFIWASAQSRAPPRHS